MTLYILKNKKVVVEPDIFKWTKWFSNFNNRLIRQDKLQDGKMLSTIFIGIDYGFIEDKPLVFETMLFSKDNEELETERYSTYKEATIGHELLLTKILASQKLPSQKPSPSQKNHKKITKRHDPKPLT